MEFRQQPNSKGWYKQLDEKGTRLLVLDLCKHALADEITGDALDEVEDATTAQGINPRDGIIE